jgi:ubiquinone/menaquinone biosynthesis C-methylase UbiE
MAFLYRLFWGKRMDDLAKFRMKAHALTEEEYRAIYESHPRVHEETDNSEACINLITQNVVGDSVCDVGCGTGFLISRIRSARPEIGEFTGVDFMLDDNRVLKEDVAYTEAQIETLPFDDNAFDTVVCTHVLEHIFDIAVAISELRRIAAKRLIVVVPLEREHIYTFNPHLHFFPFTHSFLRVMRPVDNSYIIKKVQRDIFYYEDISHAVTSSETN